MTPPFGRRELLKLAGVGLFAAGGPSAEASARSEESEVVETDLVRVTVPTTAGGNQTLVGELARDGDLYARNISAALRDETGNTLNDTEVSGVDRSGNTVEVRRRLETSASTLDSMLAVTVPEEVPGAVISHTVENVGDDAVELNTPDDFIGTDIGLGQAELALPGELYRFSVQGGDSFFYDEVRRWRDFDIQEPRAWATSFDDERAVTYGLDGPTSASDPKLAMTEGSTVNQIRLFGTLVRLEPGESATWRTAAVAHDGGPEAPASGGNLVDAAFDDGADQALVYAGSGDGLLYARTVATGDEAWTFEPDGAGSYVMHSSPTVVDGTVYVGTDRLEDDGRLYAVDAATGEQEWRFTGLGPGGLLSPSPTVVGGSVYTGGENGLFSIDAATGDPEWQYDEISIEESSPTVVDGTAYVGTEEGELYAVDATTSNVEWQYPVPADDIDSSPTVADGTAYVGTDGGTLHAVDAVTGTQEWEFTDPTASIGSSPTISDGVVYVAAADATLYALTAVDGTELWRFGLDGATEAASPTVSEGVIYQATAETLYAVDGNGTEQWRYDDMAGISSSPTVHDGTVFVGSGESDNPNMGMIAALDGTTGDVKWTADDPNIFVLSSPTVVTDPESGRSVDSRVTLRTLGHHSGEDDGGGDQNATVSGVVQDAQSGDPLSGVAVRFARANSNQEFTVETADGTQGDASGEYSIALPVDGGTGYEITVDPDGYQRFTDTITLSPGDSVSKTITLSSETATVSGFVREFSTEEPLIGVAVRFTRADTGEEFVVETAAGVEGSAPGEYSIDLPVDGETEYKITANPVGYRMFEKSITLSPDDTVTETIDLSPVPSIDIEEVRPVQVVFDAGPAEDTVELVGGKSTAVFVVPEIGDVDQIPDDAEIEVECIGDRFGDQWLGDLVGQTLTLDKADLEAFEEHDGETFGEVPSIPQFPITGDIKGPTGIDVATGDLGVAVGDTDQIDGGAATTFVDVVDIDPIHITFYRDTGKSFLTQPDLDEVQPQDYAEHVEEAVRYLIATLPIAAADLSTTVGPTFTPRRPGASQGATLTLEAIEEAHGPSGTIPAERTWSVGIYSDDTGKYWNIGAGRTKADGLGPEYRAVLVRNQNYLTTAHELGHQFGLHNGTEEYELPPGNDGEQTTNGYWVDEGEFFDTAASFMQSPNKGFTATSTRGWWPSNAIDYTTDALDYDVMMWKLSEGNAGVAPDEFDANGTATGGSVGPVESGDANSHAVGDRVLYAKGLVETDHSEADPGELGDVLDADTDRWHVYTDETPNTGPEPATGIATMAVVARDDSGDQVAERKTRVVSKFCGGQTGQIDRETDPYYAVPMPYPRTAVRIELREIDATGQVRTSDDGLVSAFDPRVEVLRGELDSIPDAGFRADDPAAIEDAREELRGIIDDIEASYDAGDDEAAAEAIRTQFATTLDDALKDDYEANEPFERTRQSVETAIDDTVDRSLDGPPALPGQDNPPQDLNGDGLYEDVTGDGEFTVADVQVFFQQYRSDAVQNNPELFNFQGENPAEVSIGDVQALFDQLR